MKLNNTSINQKTKKHILQINCKAPNLTAKIKIHESLGPIRPVINNIQALSHKVAKFISKKIRKLIALNNKYNSISSIELSENIMNLKTELEQKLLAVNIKDLYINISVNYQHNKKSHKRKKC
jgi:hypothetical protein